MRVGDDENGTVSNDQMFHNINMVLLGKNCKANIKRSADLKYNVEISYVTNSSVGRNRVLHKDKKVTIIPKRH